MTEILKGTCEFTVIEDVSKKEGNKPYKAIKVKVGNYEISRPLFINNEILYILQQELNKRA